MITHPAWTRAGTRCRHPFESSSPDYLLFSPGSHSLPRVQCGQVRFAHFGTGLRNLQRPISDPCKGIRDAGDGPRLEDS
jgi:hypothetical protein